MSEQETKLEQVEDRVEKRWPKWLAPQIRGDVSRHDLPTAIIAAFGWLCYLAFLLMLIWVVGTLVHNDMLEKEAARNITEASRSWSVQRKNAELEKAYAYNHDLRKYFNGRILADTTNENDATIEREDARYNSTLNVDGNGGMARLVIPKISVDIPWVTRRSRMCSIAAPGMCTERICQWGSLVPCRRLRRIQAVFKVCCLRV